MCLLESLWTSGFCHVICHVVSHLFQRPDSKFWWASYTGTDGRRRRCSTGVELGDAKSRDDANAALAILTKAAKKAKNGTLTESRIRKELSELLEDVTGQALHFESAEQYLHNWLSNKEGAKSKNTAVKYKQVVNSFLKSLGKRRGLALAAIVPADAERWRDGLKKDKLTPNSVNQYVKILSGAFEKARKLGYIPINPCAALDALAVDQSEGREPFTMEQAEQLALTAVGTDWEGVVWAAFYSGSRIQDIANLKWADIDCSSPLRWWLRSKAKKTGVLTHTPIIGRFRVWLEKQRRGVGLAKLFPTLAGRTSGSNSGLSTEFKRLMERAGVRGRIIRRGDGKRRTTETLSFHSFRHSYSTWLERNGVSEEDRMRLAGHATRKSHRNYVHPDPDALFDAIESIQLRGVPL